MPNTIPAALTKPKMSLTPTPTPTAQPSLPVNEHDWLTAVLAEFPVGKVHLLHCLSATQSGFSGARLWKVHTDSGVFALRQFPNQVDPDRLRWIYGVLHRAANAQVPVAVPERSGTGEPFVNWRGRQFELAKWLEGEVASMPGSTMRTERPERLQAAMKMLARFHKATETDQRREASPTLRERNAMLNSAREKIVRVAARLSYVPSNRLTEAARRLLPLVSSAIDELRGPLASWTPVELQLSPVIRDIHSGNVLFTGDDVTGIVDFDTMRIDTRWLDVARLAGSMLSPRETRTDAGWREALAAWQSVDRGREFCDTLAGKVVQFVRLLHRCNTALGGLNWLTWLFIEQRSFADPDKVIQRLNYLTSHLK